MGHVPLFSSERLRFCPSSGIYSFLIFSFLLVLLLLFHCIGCSCIDVTLFLIVVDLVSETINLFVVFVVVVAVGCCLCWCWCLACCLVVLLLGFSCFLGCLVLLFFLFCMPYGLMCCSFVDGCVASVASIRCIPDLGVGVSSFIVLFFCCFYLIKIAALIFSFSSFWFFFSF